MDEKVAEEQLCEEAELDLDVTYENNSILRTGEETDAKTFHLKKKCAHGNNDTECEDCT